MNSYCGLLIDSDRNIGAVYELYDEVNLHDGFYLGNNLLIVVENSIIAEKKTLIDLKRDNININKNG